MIRLECVGNEGPRILDDGEILAVVADVAFPIEGSWHSAQDGQLVQSPWIAEPPDPSRAPDGTAGALQRSSCSYSRQGEEVFEARVEIDPAHSCGRFVLKACVPLEGLRVGDSFETLTLHAPRFSLPPHAGHFLTTLGLANSAADPRGGYWPEAAFGQGVEALPRQAFAPFVVLGEHGALAIAPGSQFLSSALTAWKDGVVRGLHGSVDRLGAGTEIISRFATGKTLSEALMNLGEALLQDGNKQRPLPEQSLVTSHLSWWNAYGGYYTEPLQPLDESRLHRVIESLEQDGVPVRSLGLDLWYPFQTIGQALHFTPDERKYPSGLRRIADRSGLPLTLHISALAEKNGYEVAGHDAAHYRTVADDLRREGAIVVWHDWMRTQQHLSSELRHNPAKASAWYGGMTSAFREAGIGVLQCMQTMGMALASTEAPGVFGARTSLDYLFSQDEAMASLERIGQGGFRNEQVEPLELRRQNLLMGMVLHALGLLPFHDLFLTSHHQGYGGCDPLLEAALRALSCGPVGIGDGPGMTDMDVIRRVCFQDGRLLHPDHPPLLAPQSIPDELEVLTTARDAGVASWVYVLALNLTESERQLDLESLTARKMRPFDVFTRRPVSSLLSIPPRSAVYRMLAPRIDGLTLYGLWDPLVPAPTSVIDRVASTESHIRVDLQCAEGEFAFLCADPIEVKLDGQPCEACQEGGFHRVSLASKTRRIEIGRRRE